MALRYLASTDRPYELLFAKLNGLAPTVGPNT
jgi:hypothetical protein